MLFGIFKGIKIFASYAKYFFENIFLSENPKKMPERTAWLCVFKSIFCQKVFKQRIYSRDIRFL